MKTKTSIALIMGLCAMIHAPPALAGGLFEVRIGSVPVVRGHASVHIGSHSRVGVRVDHCRTPGVVRGYRGHRPSYHWSIVSGTVYVNSSPYRDNLYYYGAPTVYSACGTYRAIPTRVNKHFLGFKRQYRTVVRHKTQRHYYPDGSYALVKVPVYGWKSL